MAFDGVREVLVLHHSHMDIGYTHTPPVVWEFQREFLIHVMNFLDETAHWPEPSQPRWTIEVTSQIRKFLDLASDDEIDRLSKHLRSGRIGISTPQHNIISTLNAEQLIRQIADLRMLRERFGIKGNTFNNHDVNGLPWGLVDLLAESGVELVTMAINLYYGGYYGPRPEVFRWEGPSGRDVLVCNGEHYSMFNWWLRTEKESIPDMQAGLKDYIALARSEGWEHDFIYLTLTNAPFSYDNCTIEREAAHLIKRWNDEAAGPVIRYVTPEMLAERIKQIPRDSLPVRRGEWGDFWTLGIASSTDETAIQRDAKHTMFCADLLQATRGPMDPVYRRISNSVWWNINCYDEHTWGAARSMNHEHPNTKTQWHFKQHQAYLAREESHYLLANQLEGLAANEISSWTQEGVLLVNPTDESRTFYVPYRALWDKPDHKRLYLDHFHVDYESTPPLEIVSCQADGHREGHNDRYLAGPVELKPYSWQVVELDALHEAPVNANVSAGDGVIESPFHRLEFDAATGRITGLVDKQRDWQVVDGDNEFGFFQLVREIVGGSGTRGEIFTRVLEDEVHHICCVNPYWPAEYQPTGTPTAFRVDHDARGATLTMDFDLPGTTGLQQSITLLGESDTIELTMQLFKDDIRTPEGFYLTFPLNLPAGWEGAYDLTGAVTRIDDDQMPGTNHDWAAVDSFAAIHTDDRSVALFSPQCPLVMFGDFSFERRRRTVERHANPMLLAWPMNNFFDTNFRATQPGYIHLRFGLRTAGAFDAMDTLRAARAHAVRPMAHPALKLPKVRKGKLLEVEGDNVHVMHTKPADDGQGVIVRLQNVGHVPSLARLRVADTDVQSAWRADILEANQDALTITNGMAEIELTPHRITTVRVV
jgi:alpha-mannosidase